MPAYLHETPRTKADFEALFDKDGALITPESRHLEYKREFWKDNAKSGVRWGEEFAADVAALLNAEGGTIVVGIDEETKGVHALDGVPWGPIRQGLDSALENHLEPRAATAHVELPDVPVFVHGKPLFAIHVAPWAGGLVSVTVDRRREQEQPPHDRGARLYHLFPLRDDAKRRFLGMAEAAPMMDVHGRRTYLRLRQAQVAIGMDAPAVHIDSRILIATRLQTEPMEMVSQPDLLHGTLHAVGPDHLTLKLEYAQDAAGARLRDWGRDQATGSGPDYNRGQAILGIRRALEQEHEDQPLHVPFDLIEAVWVRHLGDSTTQAVALMLRTDLLLVVRDGPPTWVLHGR